MSRTGSAASTMHRYHVNFWPVSLYSRDFLTERRAVHVSTRLLLSHQIVSCCSLLGHIFTIRLHALMTAATPNASDRNEEGICPSTCPYPEAVGSSFGLKIVNPNAPVLCAAPPSHAAVHLPGSHLFKSHFDEESRSCCQLVHCQKSSLAMIWEDVGSN